MKKYKILQCIPNMAGGGAERQLVYISGELVRRGWDVHVALLKEGPNYAGLAASGATIHKLDVLGNYDPRIISQLLKLFRNIKPDIAQTWLTQMDVLGGISALLTRTPFILSEGSCAVAYRPNIKNRLRVHIASGASAIVSNSIGGDSYWKVCLPRTPRYIVPNGLPLDDIGRAVAAVPPGFPEKGLPLVLYVGRLPPKGVAAKNLPLILETLARVKERQEIVGVFCGEGPQLAELQSLSRWFGIEDDVHFTGHLQSPLIWALMKKASVFVSLSGFEGLPNVVLEAMACGCPLVLSDIPAHRAFLDDKKAIFVNPENVVDAANAILSCIQNSEMTKQMIQNAKAQIPTFSIPAVVSRFEEMYLQVISGKHYSGPLPLGRG